MIAKQTNTTLVLPFYTELLPIAPVVGGTYLFKFVRKNAKQLFEEITYTCTVNTGYVCKFEGAQPSETKNTLDVYVDGLNTLEILRILE